MDRKKRKTIRGWREQLVTLVNGWDPAGLLASGAPRDEYDGVVDGLLSLLSQHGTAEEVTQFLEIEILDHFGTKPKGASQFATKAISWFRIASAEK
jgi:hypothetical protein